MANGATQEWSRLDAVLRADRRVLWLDCLAYARRLFAPGQDVWSDVGPFVELVRQAQQLLESDVIELPLDAFFSSVTARRGNRPAAAVRRLLAEREPLDRAVACVRALKSLFSRVPVVLVVEGGSRWLSVANEESADGARAWDTDDIDSAAMYLADAVRNFADAGISGVVLDFEHEPGHTATELTALHRPVLNVASRSNWHRGVVLRGESLDELPSLTGELDFVLCREIEFAAMTRSAQPVLLGGGVDEKFWQESCTADLPEAALCYGRVPESAGPEEVLARLNHLRTRA